MPKELNHDNFEQEVLKSEQIVLVDFWADWCGPCKALSPVIDEVAEEMQGQVLVGKVNVDQEQDLAKTYHVMSIPTLVVYKDGKEINRSVGVVPKEDILNMIK
ncbi:MAG: thioredoxin [Tissierellia bacterium]|nr:thioredoxin [Tissierellia bacterium]